MTVAETLPGEHVITLSPGTNPSDGTAFRNFLRAHGGGGMIRVEFADSGFRGMAGWTDFLELCAEASGKGVRLAFGGTESALSALALFGVKGVVAVASPCC